MGRLSASWVWMLLAAGFLLSLAFFAARRAKAHRFLTISVLFILLFFSVAGTKLPPYILIVYPFIATMIGMAAFVGVRDDNIRLNLREQ